MKKGYFNVTKSLFIGGTSLRYQALSIKVSNFIPSNHIISSMQSQKFTGLLSAAGCSICIGGLILSPRLTDGILSKPGRRNLW